jgi:hypothetical protein
MNHVGARMKLHRFVIALGLGLPTLALPILAACNIDNGTGNPDPGLYWGWVCDGGGTPLDASTPLDYVASGSCGKGGPFTLSVDGCDMFGSWSALGLSNVTTATYTGSPGLGGWTVTADAADGGASWNCTAAAGAGGALTFTCSSEATDAAPSAVTCQSNLTPVSGGEAGTD